VKKEEEETDKKKVKSKKGKKGKKDDNYELLQDKTSEAAIEAPPSEPQQEFKLKNLDLTIKQGEFVCIIGAVGSGKSSLLSTIIGDMIYAKEYNDSPIKINQKLSYS